MAKQFTGDKTELIKYRKLFYNAMPCNDQSENIEVILDVNDSIKSFQLHKLSCIRKVGEGHLLSFIKGSSSQAVLEGELHNFIPIDENFNYREEFLLTKEFVAIQAVLAVFVGSESGSLSDVFTLQNVDVDREQTKISGIINISMISENIEACGGCCGLRTLSEPSI